MNIIDVSPDDLVLPGDCLGGAVLDGWHGPVVYDRGRALVRGTVGDRLYLCHNTGPEHPPAVAFGDAGLLCMLPAMRDRLRRVLAAGERCGDCMGYLGDEDGQCAACMPGPDGTGYTRQPRDLGWIIDAEIAGRITPRGAAGLMWASVLRVEAGMGPVRGWGTPWVTGRRGLSGEYQGRGYGYPRNPNELFAVVDVQGWSVLDNDGPETGDAGRLAADAAALSAGFALLNADHILLPLPDRIARLRLED